MYDKNRKNAKGSRGVEVVSGACAWGAGWGSDFKMCMMQMLLVLFGSSMSKRRRFEERYKPFIYMKLD
jgi:hypothetical protein